MPAHAIEDSFGEIAHQLRRSLRADDQKLLAAPAIDGIDLAYRGLDQLGELDQHLVADKMAELVVHALEMVEVEQNDRERSPVTLRALNVQRQRRRQAGAIEQASQGVGHGQLLQAPIERIQPPHPPQARYNHGDQYHAEPDRRRVVDLHVGNHLDLDVAIDDPLALGPGDCRDPAIQLIA